jgi:hypothetical protein
LKTNLISVSTLQDRGLEVSFKGTKVLYALRGSLCPWVEEEFDFSFRPKDRGLEVSFRGTKVLIHPKGSSLTSGQMIGVRDGKLFRLLFPPLHAMATSSDINSQLCELWH